MPKIRLSSRFIKFYARLPKSIQDKVDKQIRLLAEEPRHPSVRTKPIRGVEGIYEAWVDRNYRMTYQRLPGDILLLRVVARHNDALGNP